MNHFSVVCKSGQARPDFCPGIGKESINSKNMIGPIVVLFIRSIVLVHNAKISAKFETESQQFGGEDREGILSVPATFPVGALHQHAPPVAPVNMAERYCLGGVWSRERPSVTYNSFNSHTDE
eukprot:1150302-Pelagomonas_calceolata.AAC.3